MAPARLATILVATIARQVEALIPSLNELALVHLAIIQVAIIVWWEAQADLQSIGMAPAHQATTPAAITAWEQDNSSIQEK